MRASTSAGFQAFLSLSTLSFEQSPSSVTSKSPKTAASTLTTSAAAPLAPALSEVEHLSESKNLGDAPLAQVNGTVRMQYVF